MNAAETSASSAIADWTPLTVASRSSTTDEIDTFINEVSTTSTNIAIESRIGRRLLAAPSAAALVTVSAIGSSSHATVAVEATAGPGSRVGGADPTSSEGGVVSEIDRIYTETRSTKMGVGSLTFVSSLLVI